MASKPPPFAKKSAPGRGAPPQGMPMGAQPGFKKGGQVSATPSMMNAKGTGKKLAKGGKC